MIQTLPDIDACQVVGVTINGALRPVAFVIPKNAAVINTTAIIDHVAQHLARYKVPVRVFTIDRFPVTEGTNATKIQKHKLRALAQEQLNAV
jgi:fatty-acyl-CoA synthase